MRRRRVDNALGRWTLRLEGTNIMLCSQGRAMAFVLQLFGGFRLVGEDGKLTSLPDRGRALLAYLAVASSPVPRQILAELLSAEWSEQEQPTTLRQVVYLVRKAMG